MPTGIATSWGYSPENVGSVLPSFDTGYSNNNLFRNNLSSMPISFDKNGNLVYPYARQTKDYYTKQSVNKFGNYNYNASLENISYVVSPTSFIKIGNKTFTIGSIVDFKEREIKRPMRMKITNIGPNQVILRSDDGVVKRPNIKHFVNDNK